MTRWAKHFALSSMLAVTGLAGCGGSSNTPPPPPPPLVGKLYVTNGSTNSILRFKAGATGDATPENHFGLTASSPVSLALDAPHDRLAAVSFALTAILVFDNVSATPTFPRVVSGAATTLHGPQRVALDGTTNDLLYVVDNFTTILVFAQASTITGNVAPFHTMNLGFSAAGIEIDTANNRLFVSDENNAIRIFDGASGLNGAVVPDRVISGAATQLSNPGSLVLDSSGRLIVTTMSSPANVLVFANAAAANGNVAPAASAVLSATPSPFGIAVSPTGELYVVNGGSQVVVYSNIATANGSINPVRVITGPDTGLDPIFRGIPPLILGLALDPTR